MLLIVYGEYNPEVIAAVRSFRAEIYAADGVSVSDELDERSYHVVVYGEDRLAGCLRYTRLGEGAARIGGRVTATYWDEGYGCEIERLEFQLSRDPSCARRRRAAGRVEILTGPCQTFDASSRR